jgi:putative tricarboxylic transport membrane protein
MTSTRTWHPGLIAALAVLLLAGVVTAVAQDKYPSRAIEIVVPYAPGGGTDNLMRMITGIIDENKLSPAPMNVVNKPGGSGAVGYTYLLSKKGNPYVVAGATPTIVSGKVEGRIKGDHRDGMTILAIVAVDDLTLAVKSDSKYQTIEEFIKAAKERSGQLTVGGTSVNSEDHIFTYLMEKAAGIKVKYVPFNSGGEVTAALMGGHIDAAVENPNEIVAQIEAGKAKYLAVASEERLKGAPNVPTFKEKGYDVLWEQMRGVVGPGDMPAETVKWWEEALRKVSDTKKWRELYIERNLLTPVFWTGEKANTYLDGLRAKYEKALTDLGAIKK